MQNTEIPPDERDAIFRAMSWAETLPNLIESAGIDNCYAAQAAIEQAVMILLRCSFPTAQLITAQWLRQLLDAQTRVMQEAAGASKH